jgi:DNA modification methylase
VAIRAASEPRNAARAATSPDTPWTLLRGDCTELLATMPAASVDAVITDPPYGIAFQGHAWDRPRGDCSGHGDGANGARSHAAGFRYQAWSRQWASECLRVLKPGGHLVSFGAPRTAHHLACGIEAARFELRDTLMWLFGQGFPKSRNLTGAWHGWGTALKPAYEPILLARKPLAGTTQDNADAYGTGAINVDACRDDNGRWPPNVALSHSPDCQPGRCQHDCPHGLLGQRARFFYCAKANRRERDAGCDGLRARTIDTFKIGAAAERKAAHEPTRNFHPTVKPIALMRWLVRLVTAPQGLVLDPFCGSGTTGCAAVLERRHFVGIERDPDYAEIAAARIVHWANQREPEPE